MDWGGGLNFNDVTSIGVTDCMFVLPHAYVEIPTPNVRASGTEYFGKYLGHEGGALTNGISAL